MAKWMRNALQFCLRREFEAMALYDAALEHVEEEEARATLSFLAAEERRHLGELSQGLARSNLGEKVVQKVLDDLREGGRRRAREKLDEILARGPLDTETILEAALEEEKQSEEVYKLNASMMPDAEVRDFYLQLVNEEKEHVKTIKATLRLVKKGIIDPRHLKVPDRPQRSDGKGARRPRKTKP